MQITGKVIQEMIAYNYGCPELVNHALKVFSFAKAIGELEGIGERKQQVLELAAILHDIGIRVSEEKYQSYNGEYQQIEGPPIARELLERCNVSESMIDRICFLIAHHHEYNHIDGDDYQILVEADFLVNLFEENSNEKAIKHAHDTIFRTAAGKQFLDNLYVRISPAPSLFAQSLKK